jgi:hypothetical protein
VQEVRRTLLDNAGELWSHSGSLKELLRKAFPGLEEEANNHQLSREWDEYICYSALKLQSRIENKDWLASDEFGHMLKVAVGDTRRHTFIPNFPITASSAQLLNSIPAERRRD